MPLVFSHSDLWIDYFNKGIKKRYSYNYKRYSYKWINNNLWEILFSRAIRRVSECGTNKFVSDKLDSEESGGRAIDQPSWIQLFTEKTTTIN